MNLRNDPAVRSLLNRMPKNIQKTFTDEQLMELKVAIGARHWGRHSVDCRSVLRIFRYRYYFVFLAGRNRRELTSQEEKSALFWHAIFLSLLGCIGFTVFFLVAYIIKSALGIDIFPSFSLGLWDLIND